MTSKIENYLMDMDGVLVHEERLIPGADLFVKRLQQTGHRFLLLTNNSIYTPRDLAARLALTGLEVPEAAIWTRPWPPPGSSTPSGPTAAPTCSARPA
jgi:NagD protein